MQKTSTRIKHEETSMQQVGPRPRKATVEFIKQFARVYTFNPLITVGLGGLIVN